MSGLEVAGLVLGAVPIILAGLQFYAEGIQVTKRYRKYEEGVRDLLRQLRIEHSIYANSIKLVLHGVVKQKEIAMFLANPGSEQWKDPIFESNLRKRLGSSYASYLDTINQLMAIVERFKEQLRLNAAGEPQFTDKNAFKEHYKRLKFGLSKSDYKELMADLRQTNGSLHLLTTQTSSLSNQHTTVRSDRQVTPDFRHIKDQAASFHFALTNGWRCPCQANHSVSLRLEPRTEEVTSDDEDDERFMRDPFHVLFHYEHHHFQDPNITKPWIWEEADACIKFELDSQPLACIQTKNHSKGVRFAKRAMPGAVQAALNPEPNMQPIQDLCSAISTLQKPQRDVCFSLLANEIAKQKFGVLLITPVRYLPTDTASWSVSSLRAVLEDSKFAQQDRLKLAITLASSVLQLHQTPWLDENWGKDSIFFVKRPGKTQFDQPFVSVNIDQSKQSTMRTLPNRMNRVIRNRTLYALGVALIELYYRKPISDLHRDEDGPLNTGDVLSDLMTEFNTADRLAEALLSEAGAKYSDAVRRCIRCEFDGRTSSLEDTKFQKAVFRGVVAQLQENYDYLFQSYSD